MDISRLIDSLRYDLSHAAEIGGEEARSAAERLVRALDPALRLTIMEALSQAAAEISEALPGMTIDVRLMDREPVFAVHGAPAAPAGDEGFETDDDEAVARITLRLSEALKARAEDRASRRGQSLNTWLVAAIRAAVADGAGRRGNRVVRGWVR